MLSIEFTAPIFFFFFFLHRRRLLLLFFFVSKLYVIDRFNPGCPDRGLSIMREWPGPDTARVKREIKSLCPSVSVGFSGVLKENLLTHWRLSKPHSCINSARQSPARPRTYTYSLDCNISADRCLLLDIIHLYIYIYISFLPKSNRFSVKCFVINI